jgi:IclR family transcriptional regulator, acetate operon repressor
VVVEPGSSPAESRLLTRGLLLLHVVAENAAEGCGLTELANATGISKATCYRILRVLRDWQWVRLDAETKRYRLGLGLLSVVGPLTEAGGMYDAVLDVLRRLSWTAQETAGVDVYVDEEIAVVAEVQGPNLIAQVSRSLPRRMPAYCTSTGKIFLAAQEPESVLRRYAGKYVRRGSGGAESVDRFVELLAGVRAQGYAVARDEYEDGAAAVAAPVHVAGALECAIWVGGPSFRLTEERADELAPLVAVAASELSSVLEAAGQGMLQIDETWHRGQGRKRGEVLSATK